MKGGVEMIERLKKYVESLFVSYKGGDDLKEELLNNLLEKYEDFKEQGYDDDTSFDLTINSIGDVKELIDSFNDEIVDVKQDFSKMDLKSSDLKGVVVNNKKFNYSTLKDSDFSHADLTKCVFKCCDLTNVIFDGANLTDAEFNMSALKDTSFKGCTLNNTVFKTSDLSNIHLDNLTLEGTVFNRSSFNGTTFKNTILRNVSFTWSSVKKANFDGAIMDKLTYAVLKGNKANLANVTII